MHHLRSPCPGEGGYGGAGQAVLCHSAPGPDWALGCHLEQSHAQQEVWKHDTMVLTRQHHASQAAPLPHPQPGDARGSRQSRHVAAGRLA